MAVLVTLDGVDAGMTGTAMTSVLVCEAISNPLSISLLDVAS